MAHGRGTSRFVEVKNIAEKAVDIGRHIMLDQERCIQCSRCIRFCDEVSKTGELAFFRRGQRTVIGVFPERPLDNPYSGNVVDICPVGALTLKEFRFQTRVWYLENTPSICAGCARGCNVMVSIGQQRELMGTQGQLDERIKRLVPRVNDEVNGHWMCDEGRLSYQRLYAAPRVERAQSPAGTVVPWADAVSSAATALKSSGEKTAVLLSPRLTSEDMLAWRMLLEKLGGDTVGVRVLHRGEDDDLLIRADKGANSKGAEWLFGAGATEEAVVDAVLLGRVDTLIAVGDPLDPEDAVSLEARIREKIANVVYVGPFVAGAAESATVVLPAAAWSEQDGTMVNFQGRVQAVRRCHLPHGEGRPGWRVVRDLAEAVGIELPQWTSHVEVLESLAEHVDEYRGMNVERIGLLGA
jgi:NADH-quinone oxidoreductase subunit G